MSSIVRQNTICFDTTKSQNRNMTVTQPQ